MQIYTIGYEGTTIEKWVQHLISNKISCLIDIREFPISRKRGFSKTALKREVEALGIRYLHYKSLGSPSDMRKKLHDTHDYITFFEEYEKYLDGHTRELEEIMQLALSERICLLCFEHNSRQCHRSSVAKRLLSLMPKGVEIINVDCHRWLARGESLYNSKDISNA